MPRSLPDSEAAPKRLAIYCHPPAGWKRVCSTGASAFVCVRILSASGILGALTGTAAQWLAKRIEIALLRHYRRREFAEFAEVTNSLRVVDTLTVPA